MTCDLCTRDAAVAYRLVRPFDMIEFFCGGCAAAVLKDAPAKTYAGLVA